LQEGSISHEIEGKSIPSKYLISEPKPGYDAERDFTTLIAWENTRAVKPFFYNKVTLRYHQLRNTTGVIKFDKQLLVLQQISPRATVDSIIKRAPNTIGFPEGLCMNSKTT